MKMSCRVIVLAHWVHFELAVIHDNSAGICRSVQRHQSKQWNLNEQI